MRSSLISFLHYRPNKPKDLAHLEAGEDPEFTLFPWKDPEDGKECLVFRVPGAERYSSLELIDPDDLGKIKPALEAVEAFHQLFLDLHEKKRDAEVTTLTFTNMVRMVRGASRALEWVVMDAVAEWHQE